MAAPFKRVCVQVARQISQSSRSQQCRSSLAGSAHCSTISRSSQCRLYNSTARSSAAAQTEVVEEDDFDAYLEAIDENLPDESELSSTAHAELEQHRELREMVRLAAWEMPLLSPLSKPFEPPKKTKSPLRWRYTTYFSESHPASSKVVVEFDIKRILHKGDDMERKREKLRKLCGVRYNPETDSVKMSSESFDTSAKNKRFLADTVNKLLAEATDLKSGDNFEDIPLDTRHHKKKIVHQFPSAWKLTDKKREALDESRRALLLAEGERVEKGRIVNGAAEIERDRQLRLNKVEEPIMAEARQTLPRGKMGKAEMGQKGR